LKLQCAIMHVCCCLHFSIDDKYASQGKLGAAIIGNHFACDVSLDILVFLCGVTILHWLLSAATTMGVYRGGSGRSLRPSLAIRIINYAKRGIIMIT